jgi:MFS family permease
MEGLADLVFSVSKLGGGLLGQRARRKRPWATLGYLITALGTGCMALVGSVAGLVSLRAAAWFGRGFRSPLRDFLLADAVEPSHFGRVYGIERAADMLGAVAGPLIATLLLWSGAEVRVIIIASLIPSLAAAAAIFLGTRDERVEPPAAATTERVALPRAFWVLLIGVFLFGLGDFSRTFLILLGVEAFADHGGMNAAVLVYALHNLVSAAAAYPAGRIGDKRPKLIVLMVGYGLGVVTNGILAAASNQPAWLASAIVLSGVYIAIEETIEKAVAAELLPRSVRSLGFGILAGANAVGDMASSLFAGFMLHAGRPSLAFGVPAAVGCIGLVWLFVFRTRIRPAHSNGERN